MKEEPKMKLNGTVLKDQWVLLNKIGEGAFGEIYSARKIRTNELVAIKLERVDAKRQVLRIEVNVIKKIQVCPHVCRLIAWGRFKDLNYMVMDLLGENLSELRKQYGGKFDLITSLRIGIRLISIVEDLHSLGYIHRDLKPSNFVVGLTPEKRKNIYLIDFGLARKFITSNGEIRQERTGTGFRGTARYASINSHKGKDLSRRDDLWSLFYILVEFLKGNLPWRRLKDKDTIGELKCRKENNGPELCNGLPTQIVKFWEYLQKLEYSAKPDYAYLRGLLLSALKNAGGEDTKALSWEDIPPPSHLLAENFTSHGTKSDNDSSFGLVDCSSPSKSETKLSQSPTTSTTITGGEETATSGSLTYHKLNQVTPKPKIYIKNKNDSTISLERNNSARRTEKPVELDTAEESILGKKHKEERREIVKKVPKTKECMCCKIL